MEKQTEFIHKGFTQIGDFRVFTFERMNPEGTIALFAVKANLTLSRRYGIPLQALPLLCKAVLKANQDTAQRRFEFSEDDMKAYAKGVNVSEPRKPVRTGRQYNPDGTARIKTLATDPPRERPVGFFQLQNR